jgi:hypothetical protein
MSKQVFLVAGIMALTAGCSDSKPGDEWKPKNYPANPENPNEPPAEKAARSHAYWSETITSDRLTWLLGEIQNTRPGRTFIFDRRAYQNAFMDTASIRKPDDVRQAGIPEPAWVSVTAQWSREKALEKLNEALDEAVKRRKGN